MINSSVLLKLKVSKLLDCLLKATTVMTSKLDRALKVIVVGLSSKKFGDFQLKRSSLPICMGGLGITLPVDLLD